MGPQIRLLQNNNTMMAEKIQSTIVNTIPLWKNQMVLALGLAHSQQAMQAERAVTNMTNDLDVYKRQEHNAASIATAFENQLDALYAAESMDLSADLTVLQNMLKGQGLSK